MTSMQGTGIKRKQQFFRAWACFLFPLLLVACRPGSQEEPLRIAVAANFLPAARAIAKDFEAEVSFSSGSTGLLYAQITQGAPFDVFLAADKERPRLLFEAGLAEELQHYATGQLVLYVRAGALSDGCVGLCDLNPTRIVHAAYPVAIANPETAPYGRAAMETLRALGAAPSHLAEAQSVAGVLTAVETGAAGAGFVALSSLRAKERVGKIKGAHMLIPEAFYSPLEQHAAVLKSSRHPKAQMFLMFLQRPENRQRVAEYGYLLPQRN